jgi:Domain of unknown function (DUF4041)
LAPNTYKLEAAIERLAKVAATIAHLGKTMDIRIAEGYHHLRVQELALTADYVQKVAEDAVPRRYRVSGVLPSCSARPPRWRSSPSCCGGSGRRRDSRSG